MQHDSLAHLKDEKTGKYDLKLHSKKSNVAKKMKPIGQEAHDTFKKLGKAVGKLGATHKKYGDKPF